MPASKIVSMYPVYITKNCKKNNVLLEGQIHKKALFTNIHKMTSVCGENFGRYIKLLIYRTIQIKKNFLLKFMLLRKNGGSEKKKLIFSPAFPETSPPLSISPP